MSQSSKKWKKKSSTWHFRNREKQGARTQERNPLHSKLNPAWAPSKRSLLVQVPFVVGFPWVAAAILEPRMEERKIEVEEEGREIQRNDSTTQRGHKGKERARKWKIQERQEGTRQRGKREREGEWASYLRWSHWEWRLLCCQLRWGNQTHSRDH